MKIREFGDEVYFDDFPKLYNPKNKVFLTCLLNFEELKLPTTMIPKIYTSEVLKLEILEYYKMRGIDSLNASQIVVMKPFQKFDLKLSNGGLYECLPCEGNDASRYLLLLFRDKKSKGGIRVTHLYAGIFTDIISLVLNNEFCTWIHRSGVVERIYLYLKLSQLKEDHQALEDIMAAIDLLIEEHEEESTQIIIQLAYFGYENFIAKLAAFFPHRVFPVGGLANKPSLRSITRFAKNVQKARIIIASSNVSIDNIRRKFKLTNVIRVSLIESNEIAIESRPLYCYELKYSPLPGNFELKLLIQLVHAKRIHGIVNKYNIETRPPKHLMDISKKYRNNETKDTYKRKNREDDDTHVGGSSPLKTAKLSPNDKTKSQAHCTELAKGLLKRKTFQYVDSEGSSS